jgi:hypothetical protein
MKRFLKKSLVFLLPVAAYMLAVSLVDPYSMFRSPVQSGLTFRQSLKDSVAAGVDNALFKIVRFRNDPCPNIILGDSRMYSLDSNRIRDIAGERYFNLSIQGSSFREIADAFWFAAERTELKRAYIGLNFLLFNESFRKDRTSTARAMIGNPLLYFCNYTVVKPTAYMMYTLGSGAPDLGRPNMTKEEFWRHVLFKETVPGYLNKYVYPTSYVEELRRMADYARGRGIDLRFVVPPTHVDLQKRVAEMGFAVEEAKFKAQLRALAPTYDFEYPNPLTGDTANFKDPMHYTPEVGLRLISEIWGDSLVNGRFTRPDSLTGT